MKRKTYQFFINLATQVKYDINCVKVLLTTLNYVTVTTHQNDLKFNLSIGNQSPVIDQILAK